MSQRKHKAKRKGKVKGVKSVEGKKKKHGLIFFASLITAILATVSCIILQSALSSDSTMLQDGDFQVTFQWGTSQTEFSDLELKKSKKVVMRTINNLPEKEVRNHLISLIKSGELHVKYTSSNHLSVFGSLKEFCFNPSWVLANQEKDGYLGSFMVHEHHHLQDWLGNNSDGLNYKPCELSGYQSKECMLEWWDAEWRAVKEQAQFLRKYDCTDEMTTGPNVNNRAIFEKYDPEHAALEFLRINYYIGRMIHDPDLLEMFPEFYRNKFKEIE